MADNRPFWICWGWKAYPTILLYTCSNGLAIWHDLPDISNITAELGERYKMYAAVSPIFMLNIGDSWCTYTSTDTFSRSACSGTACWPWPPRADKHLTTWVRLAKFLFFVIVSCSLKARVVTKKKHNKIIIKASGIHLLSVAGKKSSELGPLCYNALG